MNYTNLDCTLAFLNEGNLDNCIDIMIESKINELSNFSVLTENLDIINEKVDIKTFISKAIETVKSFFKKIKEIIGGFVQKIKTFLGKIKDKISPTYYDDWDDDWEDFDLDFDDEFFDESVEVDTVMNMIKAHKYIALPMLTKAINLDNFRKVEDYINDVEINKRASTDSTHHGNVVLSRREKGGIVISRTICKGNIDTIIFTNDEECGYLLSGGDNVSESINEYINGKTWVKAHNLKNCHNLYTYCREVLKYGETKALADYLSKLNNCLDRLNTIIDKKFNFIQKSIADKIEDKYAGQDSRPSTLLTAFRHTARCINNDINTLNIFIGASIKKTQDAAFILGYISAKNESGK